MNLFIFIYQQFDFKRYVASRHKTIAKSPLSNESRQALEAPCDLMRPENFCLAVTYFTVGIIMTFMMTPLNIYLVRQLNAEPQQQNVSITLHKNKKKK